MSALRRDSGGEMDLLRLPLLRPFLGGRYGRPILQSILLLLSVTMILHGLFGPSLAPKNLATTLTWVHYRGALIIVLVAAGNFFCFACPFVLVRTLARRFVRPQRVFPRALRNKWLALSLFVAVLFAYELFDLWGSPWWTAWLIVGYFAAALLVDLTFKHASFCKFVCPIGQFNFVASLLSPLEVGVREPAVCTACKTKDCIRGRRAVSPSGRELTVIQPGCELALSQPQKVGNMDCTFCMDCVRACPHDNIAVRSRLPGSELMGDPNRSGIGRLSRRPDLAALCVVFTFGSLLNAFGMVSPVYTMETWLSHLLHTRQEAPVLGLIYLTALVVGPALLLAAAAALTRRAMGSKVPLLSLIVRFSYALVPLGLAVWLSHYAFHFLTGFWTFVPVVQSALADAGIPIWGEPFWGMAGLPRGAVVPMEMGFLGLGWLGALLVGFRIAEEVHPAAPFKVYLPWAGLSTLLWGAAMWLMTQPMEMRGTFLSG